MDDANTQTAGTHPIGWMVWAQQVADRLEEGFGVPFHVVAKADEWVLLNGFQMNRCSADLVLECENARHHKSPRLTSFADGLCLLVPLHENGHDVVLFGALNAEQKNLAIPLAMALVANVTQQQKLDELSSRLGEFAFQVTSDFEELTWLRGLAEHVNVCTPQNDLAAVAAAILPTLRQILGAECLQTFVTDSATGDQRLIYEVGHTDCRPESLRAMLHSFPAGTERIVVRNASNVHSTIAGLEHVTSLILVPMARGQRHFGWLVAINKVFTGGAESPPTGLKAESLSAWEFGTFEAGLLNAAGLMLTTHAHNVEAFRQIEQLLVGVIRAMINVIDAKDAYTCGHSDRVALIAKAIAQALGLSELEQERIYLSGLLHDVGKIGIPDVVLGKPGQLTPEEFAVVKRHPEIGYAILKHLRQLHHVLPGVLHHHEAVDGSGYPHQLAGDKIPLIGRVLAVADAYDAMTSDRPYRSGMPTAKAEAILREGAGKQWDARVVEAFFRSVEEARAICGVSRNHTQDLIEGQCFGATESMDLISQAVMATLT